MHCRAFVFPFLLIVLSIVLSSCPIPVSSSNNGDSAHVLWSWGVGRYGRLGFGDEEDRVVPTPLLIDSVTANAVSIASGGYHSVLAARNGTVYCWGLSPGSGASDTQDPVPMDSLSDFIVAVSAGTYHSLALSKNGSIWSWGKATDGRLGDGQNVTDKLSPVKVLLISDAVVEVSAGGRHNLARTRDGRVYAWGYGGDGALGTGSLSSSSTPLEVEFLRWLNVTRVSAGATHSLAVTVNSTGGTDVWIWGRPLGVDSAIPIHVNLTACGNSRIVDISAGLLFSLLRTEDGNVFAWGEGSDGQLGISKSINATEPVAVPLGGASAVAIGAGSSCAAALCSIGEFVEVRTWGSGSCLGANASDAVRLLPWPVVSPPKNLTSGIQIDVWRHVLLLGVEYVPEVYDPCAGGTHNCDANAACTFDGVSKYTCECFPSYYDVHGNGTWCLKRPVSPFKFHVRASAAIGFCSRFTAQATYEGAGNYPIYFQWSIVSAYWRNSSSTGTNVGNGPRKLGKETSEQSLLFLEIPRDELTYGPSGSDVYFTIQITGRNFFKEESTVQVAISRKNYAVPTLYFANSRHIVYGGVSETVRLGPIVAMATCDSNDNSDYALDFSWSCGNIVFPSSVFTKSKNLVVPGGIFHPNITHVCKVSSWPRGQASRNTSATIEVTVLTRSLLAWLLPNEHAQVGVGRRLTLDASRSKDPDAKYFPGNVTLIWKCESYPNVSSARSRVASMRLSDGCPASLDSFMSVSSLVIPELTLATDKFLSFSVCVRKSNRESCAYTVIETLPGSPPIVSIAGPSTSQVSPKNRLVLVGDVQPSSGEQLSDIVTIWSIADNSPSPLNAPLRQAVTTSTSSLSLALKPNMLPVGETVVFKLTAISVKGGTSASSTWTARVASPPCCGTCSVSPTTGTALNTTFSIFCTEFSSGAQPVVFMHSVVLKTDDVQQHRPFWKTDSSGQYVLPEGAKAIIVSARGPYGMKTDISLSVTVNPVPAEEVNAYVDGRLQQAVEMQDRESVILIVLTVAETLRDTSREGNANYNPLGGGGTVQCPDSCGHGVCRISGGAAFCSCVAGYTGTFCDARREDVVNRMTLRRTLVVAVVTSFQDEDDDEPDVSDVVTQVQAVRSLMRDSTEVDDRTRSLSFNFVSNVLTRVRNKEKNRVSSENNGGPVEQRQDEDEIDTLCQLASDTITLHMAASGLGESEARRQQVLDEGLYNRSLAADIAEGQRVLNLVDSLSSLVSVLLVSGEDSRSVDSDALKVSVRKNTPSGWGTGTPLRTSLNSSVGVFNVAFHTFPSRVLTSLAATGSSSISVDIVTWKKTPFSYATVSGDSSVSPVITSRFFLGAGGDNVGMTNLSQPICMNLTSLVPISGVSNNATNSTYKFAFYNSSTLLWDTKGLTVREVYEGTETDTVLGCTSHFSSFSLLHTPVSEEESPRLLSDDVDDVYSSTIMYSLAVFLLISWCIMGVLHVAYAYGLYKFDGSRRDDGKKGVIVPSNNFRSLMWRKLKSYHTILGILSSCGRPVDHYNKEGDKLRLTSVQRTSLLALFVVLLFLLSTYMEPTAVGSALTTAILSSLIGGVIVFILSSAFARVETARAKERAVSEKIMRIKEDHIPMVSRMPKGENMIVEEELSVLHGTIQVEPRWRSGMQTKTREDVRVVERSVWNRRECRYVTRMVVEDVIPGKFEKPVNARRTAVRRKQLRALSRGKKVHNAVSKVGLILVFVLWLLFALACSWVLYILQASYIEIVAWLAICIIGAIVTAIVLVWRARPRWFTEWDIEEESGVSRVWTLPPRVLWLLHVLLIILQCTAAHAAIVNTKGYGSQDELWCFVSVGTGFLIKAAIIDPVVVAMRTMYDLYWGGVLSRISAYISLCWYGCA